MAIPISVFILTSFMREIPREIEESAFIDGCSRYQIFFKMILPLSKPGLSTLATLTLTVLPMILSKQAVCASHQRNPGK